MKKLVMALIVVFALSSVAFASPLTDYSKGKAALDINYRSNPDFDANVGVNGTGWKSDTISFDGDSNLEWGFTYGIGNNWALQYRQATPKGKVSASASLPERPEAAEVSSISGSTPDWMWNLYDRYHINSISGSLEAKARVEEYNVMYKLNKNFALFTGAVKASPTAKLSLGMQRWFDTDYSGDIALAGHDKNIWQFGLQAVAPFADNFTAYGIAAFGSDYRNWEAGIGYQLAKDVELNVNYRDMKIDNMTMVGLSIPTENITIGDVTSDAKIKGWGFGITYKF